MWAYMWIVKVGIVGDLMWLDVVQYNLGMRCEVFYHFVLVLAILSCIGTR